MCVTRRNSIYSASHYVKCKLNTSCELGDGETSCVIHFLYVRMCVVAKRIGLLEINKIETVYNQHHVTQVENNARDTFRLVSNCALTDETKKLHQIHDNQLELLVENTVKLEEKETE